MLPHIVAAAPPARRPWLEFLQQLRHAVQPLLGKGEVPTDASARACVEAFGCIAHVITSESMNWYLMYPPESTPDETAPAQACAKTACLSGLMTGLNLCLLK